MSEHRLRGASPHLLCSIFSYSLKFVAHQGTAPIITANQMSSSEKTRQVVDALATLARTAQLLPGLSLGDVGSLLGKHQSNISRLAKRFTKSPKLQAIVDELVLSFL